jgi:hypothetical protein
MWYSLFLRVLAGVGVLYWDPSDSSEWGLALGSLGPGVGAWDTLLDPSSLT